MPAVIRMKSGQEFVCDRGLSADEVKRKIDGARMFTSNGSPAPGELVGLKDNRTPSRTFYVDPNEVEAVWHDGHDY